MIICGIKVTHDAGVAVIDGDRLVFNIDVEKVDEGRRYSSLTDLDQVEAFLRREGLDVADIDCFVVDGWFAADGEAPVLETTRGGRAVRLPTADYVNDARPGDMPVRHWFGAQDGAGDLAGGVLGCGYAAYTHVAQHVVGAYCTGPFASRGEPALVLAWDGGMLPRLHLVDVTGRPTFLGPLFPMVGDVFVEFCMQFDPFRRELTDLSGDDLTLHHLEVPGKAMAYAALGSVDEEAYKVFDRALDDLTAMSLDAAVGRALAAKVANALPTLTSADLIATFQGYIGATLRGTLATFVRNHEGTPGIRNLCLGGGCALNIKWNSVLRDSELFDEIWVPPFPNDAGAAIGAACCELVAGGGGPAIAWDVYSGPDVIRGGGLEDRAAVSAGWARWPCDEAGLAELLHVVGEPVTVVDGRAELGPRALGNRSILAPATDSAMKERLNRIKGRAWYRPVAPICLQARAAEVFEPGGRDPYMLMEHRPRPPWADRIPAVVHLDGTARLQTIRPGTPGTSVGRILAEYERRSGVPVLCNTSANRQGHGFFADVAAAMSWGRTPYVWSAGMLYVHPDAREDRP